MLEEHVYFQCDRFRRTRVTENDDRPAICRSPAPADAASDCSRTLPQMLAAYVIGTVGVLPGSVSDLVQSNGGPTSVLPSLSKRLGDGRPMHQVVGPQPTRKRHRGRFKADARKQRCRPSDCVEDQ
jgi:hypothetical protein